MSPKIVVVAVVVKVYRVVVVGKIIRKTLMRASVGK